MSLLLEPYLKKYKQAGPRYYNQTYDYARIEKALEVVQIGQECLKPEHVSLIFDDENTPFAKYWPRPKANKTLRNSLPNRFI